MKTRFVKATAVIIFALFTLSVLAPAASAQSPIRKLGRGLANTTTGFLELPVAIVDVAEEEGYVAAVTYGIVKGVAMSALRMGVGVYEMVTFIIPLPWGYGPILEPEFIMGEENY